MWTFLFMIMLFSVFVKMVGLAVRMSWGLMKIFVNLVFFPLVLIGLVFGGMLIFALPILIVVGIVLLVIYN